LSNKLEISNWNQLVRARSNYENLRIVVKQYNGEDITGTQILIVDYNNNNVYFSGFVTDLSSTLIPTTATISNDNMLNIINSFGFNIAYSEPIVLSDEVITILKGYYEQGYRYVYKDYPRLHNCPPYAIYVSDQVDLRYHDLIISKSPSFLWDMWEWCIPFKTYPIKDLIDNGTVNNGLPI
jgi:hypothetical protein